MSKMGFLVMHNDLFFSSFFIVAISMSPSLFLPTVCTLGRVQGGLLSYATYPKERKTKRKREQIYVRILRKDTLVCS